MPSRRRSSRAARQAVELALAVPQVVAHRTMRMALAGASPSSHDQSEFWPMGTEKALAFSESWMAMFAEAARVNQQLALSMLRAFWFPWMSPMPTVSQGSARMQRAALGVVGKGIGPVHRRAVSNAKRLGRVRL
jgi:hypothetical protein